MKLEELALCTREEFEQELNKMCPDSKCKNPSGRWHEQGHP